MAATERYDLLVLGAGSAGYAAARAASDRGARVGLVEPGPVGGLCIQWGCMPSKALLRSTEVLTLAREAGSFGVRTGEVTADFPAIMARKTALITGFRDHRVEQIRKLPHTTWIEGSARFVGQRDLVVGERRLHGKHVVIATGSQVSIPPLPGLADCGFITSQEALSLSRLPASMAVIGGGVIALELGQFFARLGVEVTLLERGPRLLMREDADLATSVTEALCREPHLTIRTDVEFLRVERTPGGKRVVTRRAGREEAVDVEEIFVATGREPRVEALDLKAAGVERDGLRLKLTADLRTTNPHVWAAGDANGYTFLVHVAIAEGELAAINALEGTRLPIASRVVPQVIFTEPNLARVGPTEAELQSCNRPVLVGRYDFAELGKALIHGDTAGFVKLIADARSGELLGAQVVGPHGGELIHELVVAIQLRATVQQFLDVPHVHPTLAEIWTYPAESIAEQLRAQPSITWMPSGYADPTERL